MQHLKAFFTATLLATAVTTAGAEGTSRLSAIADGYSSTSVNAAIFRANSLATYGDKQYACFYDPEGYVTVASRRLGTDDWEVVRTQYKGNVEDAHNVISMGIDADGYLHLAFDHHGHPLHYCRSLTPGGMVFGPLEAMTGRDEEDVTYPEFHTLADGTLLFAYRSGFSGGGNMVLNRYDTATRSWTSLHDILLDGQNERNAYWQICTDTQGTVHLSWVWRETWLVETNHDLCYACSHDGGLTWQRSDGTPYTLPITADTAELAWAIPQNSELINQTSMTADAAGCPMIATYWRDEADTVPRYRLVSFDGKGWNMETVGERTTPFSLSGGGTKSIPISRPKVMADGENIFYIYRDAERGSHVSMSRRPLAGGNWTTEDLTDFSVNAWEPSADNTLWREHGILNIYVQNVSQGDGERTVETPPQTVYVLEYTP